MEKEKDLKPGDKGYPGGVFTSTVRINGQNKNVRIVKDQNGNIIYARETNKILGIF